MVEVVVTLTECDESCNNVVARRVTIIEGLFTQPVSKRVDTEGCLLDKSCAKDASIHKASIPVTPSQTANKSRDDKGHGQD
jgi:hypothetical protein